MPEVWTLTNFEQLPVKLKPEFLRGKNNFAIIVNGTNLGHAYYPSGAGEKF